MIQTEKHHTKHLPPTFYLIREIVDEYRSGSMIVFVLYCLLDPYVLVISVNIDVS